MKTVSPEVFQNMHRLSFGHRNRRSYVVIVYSPKSADCAAIESEIERLAAGIKHDRSIAVMRVNAELQGNRALVQQLLQVGAGYDCIDLISVYLMACSSHLMIIQRQGLVFKC